MRLFGLVLALMGVSAAMAVPGVTFYASFDRWLLPEVALGGRMPVKVVGLRPGQALGPGKLGSGLALDGNGYVEYPAGASVAAKAGTVAAWYRPQAWGSKTYDNFMGLSDSDTNALEFERSHPDGRLRIVVGGPQSKGGGDTRNMWSKGPLRDGEWVHVAASWDHEQQRAALWVNGKLEATLEGPGPLPQNPPGLLVGCGWGRLARAAQGMLDEVLVLDHAVTAEELALIMKGLKADETGAPLENSALTLHVDRERGELSLGSLRSALPEVLLGPGKPEAKVDGKSCQWEKWGPSEAAPARGAALGTANHQVFPAAAEASGLALRYHVQVYDKQPLALVWMEVVNASGQPVRVEELSPVSTAVGYADTGSKLRVFTDNGSLMGSGSRDLAGKSVQHTAHGAMVVTDPEAAWAVSHSFVSFETAAVTNAVWTGEQGKAERIVAQCAYPNGYTLAPGAALQSEVFCVGVHDSPHQALERWADTVMAVNELQPPRFCPSGWNSWYCYRLTITEDLILEHARFIKEHWDGLGLENIQIDHGWQYRDIIGNWIANDRFPHGLPWLSEQLKQMGFSLGLWTAVTGVSEFAPLYQEHPEALIAGADGKPLVTGQHWYWAPHGKTFTLDPTAPAGLAEFHRWGEALRSYGCTYNKNDFQGDLLTTSGQLADKLQTRGAPVYRKGMGAFAAGKGPQMAYHACNAPLNIVAGLADVAWVHGDIGNPAGNWQWLRGFVRDFSCRYHVSGKFYWSDPDYLQIGQGTLQEARVRMVICALGGGPAFLSDRLPELTKERLALIPKCLPSYKRCAKPLDLFERDDYPRLWDLPVQTKWGQWHVLGVFSLEEKRTSVTVDLSQLGLEPGRAYLIYDFFGEKLLGEVRGLSEAALALKVPMPVTDVRLLKVVAKETRPFVLSTDLHLTQGGVELPEVKWEAKTLTLSGVATRAKGLAGKLVVYVPEGYVAQGMQGRLLTVPVKFEGKTCRWAVSFKKG